MGGRGPRSAAILTLWAACAALVFLGFVALGTWQVERRAWKLDLIARVEQRVHAAPVDAPPPAQWPHITPADYEYRHIRLSGRWLHAHATLVQANTVLGNGFWVLTPLQMADGSTVLVNRGFVPPEARDRASRSASETDDAQLTGLLRITEPGGAFLHRNDPASHRWYSRDVQAIAADQGLQAVAPYFVDADAAPTPANSSSAPVGGLTVIRFANSHAVYALTWYALALMVAAAAIYLGRVEFRLRRKASSAAQP